jgi:hypothetical protein
MGNLFFDTCTFSIPSVNAGAILFVNNIGSATADSRLVTLVNCTHNAGADKSIGIGGGVTIIENLALAGTAPTTLFILLTNVGAAYTALVSASDFSNLAWTNLINVNGGGAFGTVKFQQCKLRASFVVTTGAFEGPGSPVIELMDCDSGDNQYTYQMHSWQGTVIADATKYADASDGTTPISWLMTSSANASFTWPLTSPRISFFNSTLSAMTTTVAVAHNGVGGGTGGKLLNSEMWQATLAKVTSGFTLGTWNRDDRVADILTAGADQDTDATTSWTGASIATHDKLVSGSFTPAEVGSITVGVRLAKPSVAVYVNPKVLSGSGKQWMSLEGVYVNEAAAVVSVISPMPTYQIGI